MRLAVLALTLATGLAWAASAEAVERFDFVYVSHLEVVLPLGSIGFASGNNGFAVLVNTGALPIGTYEIGQAEASSTSSTFTWGVNELAGFAPIAGGTAVGCIGPLVSVLTSEIEPGEVLVNSFPVQVMGFGMRLPGTFAGTMTFEVGFAIGAEVVRAPVQVDVLRDNRYSVRCLSAARLSSTHDPVAVATNATWSKLKALYR